MENYSIGEPLSGVQKWGTKIIMDIGSSSSDVPYYLHILEHGVDGFLFRPNSLSDLNEITQKMVKSNLNDPVDPV